MGFKPVRVAVIGVGTISQAVHLPALRRLAADYDLRAVCDASACRAAEVAQRYGPDVRYTTDPQALLSDDDVEAVILATPGSHAALVRTALEAGRHVLAEKPLSLTVREAAHLHRLAEWRDLILQVGYMKMYDPLVDLAARQYGKLGQARLIRVTVLHPSESVQVEHLRLRASDDVDAGLLEAAEAAEAAAAAEALGPVPAELSGYYRRVLAGSVAHELSVLRALGVALPVRFDHTDAWPWPGDGQPPSLLASARGPGDCRIVLSWNWLPGHPDYGEEVAVFASGRRMMLDLAAPYLLEGRSRLRVSRATRQLRAETHYGHGHDSGFVRQLEAFAHSVRSGEPPRSTAAGAAADLACLQALFAALASRFGFTAGGEAGSRAAA